MTTVQKRKKLPKPQGNACGRYSDATTSTSAEEAGKGGSKEKKYEVFEKGPLGKLQPQTLRKRGSFQGILSCKKYCLWNCISDIESHLWAGVQGDKGGFALRSRLSGRILLARWQQMQIWTAYSKKQTREASVKETRGILKESFSQQRPLPFKPKLSPDKFPRIWCQQNFLGPKQSRLNFKLVIPMGDLASKSVISTNTHTAPYRQIWQNCRSTNWRHFKSATVKETYIAKHPWYVWAGR